MSPSPSTSRGCNLEEQGNLLLNSSEDVSILASSMTATTDSVPTCRTVTSHISDLEARVTREVSKEISMSWCGSMDKDVEMPLEEKSTSTNSEIAPPKVTQKRKRPPLSEVSTSFKASTSFNMTWITEEENEFENDLNVLATSSPKETRTPLRDTMIPALNEGKDHNEKSCKQCSSNQKTIAVLEEEIAYLRQENERLHKLSAPKSFFSIDLFSSKDHKILYYTGFQNYQIFCLVFKWVLPSGNISDINIHNSSPEKKKIERPTKLSAENQFFLTLIRLRRGLPIETLSDLFGISKACTDNIFLSWINLLYLRLGSLDIWPDREVLLKRGSDTMREKYPNVIGSIDCTEFFIQRPSSLLKQSQCYSKYKGATTLKSLLMIDPSGAIIYASPLFTGSISDRALIEQSGFMDILKEKMEHGYIFSADTILADKGFNVGDLFQNINLEINIPVFRVGDTQFTIEEVQQTRKVAHERIHVERAIGRLKNYNLLSRNMTISSLGSMEQIYTVCVLLSNFRAGLIKQK